MSESSAIIKAGDQVLELFTTSSIDLGALNNDGNNGDTPIQRPTSDLIVAKNELLRSLFEDNTDIEQAKVLESLAQHVGTTALNLSWVNLSGMRLNKLQLPYVNLRAAVLNGTQLIGANLRGIDFSEALGRNIDLTDSIITGANAVGAVFQGVDLTKSKAQNVDWTDADLTGAKLTNALMVGSFFTKASLARVSWEKNMAPIMLDSTSTGVVCDGPVKDLLI